jgi:hypothetical protein
VTFLGVFPASIAAAFAVWAERRRVALRWPLIGIVAVSILASLINVEFVITGGASPGYAGAGIGISTKTLLEHMARAIAVAACAAAPLLIALRRGRRDADRAMI